MEEPEHCSIWQVLNRVLPWDDRLWFVSQVEISQPETDEVSRRDDDRCGQDVTVCNDKVGDYGVFL